MSSHRITRTAGVALSIAALAAPSALADNPSQSLVSPDARDAAAGRGTSQSLVSPDAQDAAAGRGTFSAPEVTVIKVPSVATDNAAAAAAGFSGPTQASAPVGCSASSCSPAAPRRWSATARAVASRPPASSPETRERRKPRTCGAFSHAPKRTSGFIYESSMFAQDFEPYWCRTGDVVEPSGVATFGPEKCARMWVADLDYMVDEIPGGVFTMCFHPEVIGRGARVRVLERMIARGKEHGARFMTARAAAEDWIGRHPFGRPAAAPSAGRRA